MKKIRKVTLKLIKILFIVIILFIVVLSILEIIIKQSANEDINKQWYNENEVINNMMRKKLSNNERDSVSNIWKYVHEDPVKPKGDKKRILIVGDSYVWGNGYTNPNMIWWQQLRNMLELNGYNNVELEALGYPGYSTQDEVKKLSKKEITELYRPHLIIIGYIANDAELMNEKGKYLLPIRWTDDLAYMKDSIILKGLKKFWPNLYSKFNDIIFKKYGNDKKFCEKYGYDYYTWLEIVNNEPWLTTYEEKVIIPLKTLMKEKLPDTELVFISLNSYPDPSEIKQYENIMNKIIENSLRFENLLPKYIKKYPNFEWDIENWIINPTDYHPGYKVANFYAEEVFAMLKRDYSHIIGNQNEVVDIPIEINDTLPYMLDAKLIDNNTYEFIYPKKGTENAFLTLPIKKPYVKLNLKYPKKITRIEITGENIESIHLFTNQINKELGYDDNKLKDFGEKEGSYVWKIKDEEITSINISAKIKNDDEKKLEMIFD